MKEFLLKKIDWLKNKTIYLNKYKTNHKAIIISCYYNPHKNPYRQKAFDIFYNSIKHLNHKIVECVIDGTEPDLIGKYPNIERVDTNSMLWHKEALLNNLIKKLDEKYEYVFWIDADVLFTNKNWLVESVNNLKINAIIQPFEYCVHLEKDEIKPSFNLNNIKYDLFDNKNLEPNKINNKVWRSFCSNIKNNLAFSSDYDRHGHVGFAWGAKRKLLDLIPLYDKALVGGADHIIAHASVGEIKSHCIQKSFTDDLDNVVEWSRKFSNLVKRKVGYTKGDLYHIWHGDLTKREYLKRIKEFTPTAKTITQKDENGLYVTNNDSYVRNYFNNREVITSKPDNRNELLESLFILNNLNNITQDINEININNHINHQNDIEYGGGDFGGAGAGSEWDINENFS